MKKIVTLILGVLICICGYAQTIDPVLLEEMGQRRDNEKIRVFVVMRQQYDQQQLNRRAAHFTTRAERREFVVNELKQFAEASQYDLRHSLSEMQRNELVSEPQVLWIANAIFFEATRDAILSLADRPDIMVIGFDKERNWLPDGEEAQPADPTREITTNVTQVNADQVWNLGYTGQGVVVAVIDTGVNYNHLDLADHLWDGGTEFPHHGYDVYNNDNNPMDDHGHGTHCAGTVCGDGTAGSQTGMAPDATLMIVKCLGSGGSGSNSTVLNAMQWAVEHGCDVISMSLGGHRHSAAEQTITRNTCVNVLAAGVIASIAAGNEGDDMGMYPIPDNVGLPGGCPPPYLDPEQEQNPGGLSCSVCVGAVNSNDQATDFTSHGPRDWSASDYADYPYTPGSLTEFGLIRPDVCAPGYRIKSANYSSNNGYTTMSGTSMATPCVAGCMALMLSKDIDATPADVCRILEETAAPLSTGKSNIYGYGRVDVLAAINAMYSGPLTLDSFTINDGQGNNDGKLNAGEAVTLNFTLTNDSDVALDGATMVLTTESDFVTITNGTANLPHFNVGQTRTINNMFAFTLSDDTPAKRLMQFRAETFVNGESLGSFMIGIMVYGHILRFVEVTVLNDNNGNGLLDAGETANLHITLCNVGNELASSIMGTLSTTYPYLVINSNNKSFGTIGVNEQASANFNVSLSISAPESYAIDLSLDLVDANQKHTNVEFELWKKAITLSSDPAEGGILSGGGYYGQGQTCTITATANPGYAFVKWTKNGTTVSYLSSYSFEITGEAEYVAHFQTVTNGVVIGDGAEKNSYLPTTVINSYALSEQIYTANELNLGACELSSVSFFNTTYSFTRDLTIYMVNTSKTAFSSNTDWIAVTEANQVYSGSVTFSTGWTTVYFTTPFAYDGTSNVALIVDDNSNSIYLGGSMSCRVSSTESCQALCAYNLYTNYNPYNPTYNGTQYTVKNQVIFGIASYDYTVTVSANPTNGGTVSGGGGPYYYGYPITLTATANEGYVFSSWTKNGTVVSCLSTAQITVTETAEYVANFQQVNGIAIGDASNTNAYLPTYNYYSLTEQIYTSEEMGGTPCQISSVSFFNTGTSSRTRNMNIYMVSTDKTSFDGISDWISVSESNKVFSGNVTFTAQDWVTVYFNTPFNYNGSSNVALIVDDNSNSYNYSTSCRTFTTEGNQAIRINGSDTNYDPCDPNGFTGSLMSVKNQVIFGIPSYDYTVMVSANPTNGGTVSGGGLCYLNQPVTLTATPNEGYVFNYWTKNGEVISYFSNYTLTVTESAEYVANFLQIEGIVIGDASNTNAYLPTYSYYPYSLTQQIYTVDEMGGEAAEISTLSFFNTGSAKTRNFSIYLVYTDKTTFESTTDWVEVSEADLVFRGSVNIAASNWTTINFNTPFNYDGTSNVVLVIDDNSGSWNSGISCRTFSAEGNQALRITGYSENFDPTEPSGYIGTLMSVKNQVVFGFPSYDFTVTATTNPTNGGTIYGGGLCYYGQTVTLVATPNEGYIFSNWTKDGEVVSYVSKYSLTVTESAEYVANFELAPDGIVIGDVTFANAYLPTYSYYSLTEQIYTSAEMGSNPCQISSVSFFNTGTYNRTRNMNIYMVSTDKTSFDSISDWIPVSEANLVYSGNVTFPVHDWATVYFSTPFNYDGSSNVVLIVDDNTNSYNTYTSCRAFGTEISQAIYINGSGTNYDPYNPSEYTGTLMLMKNQVIFGIPSYDFTVTITASPTEGGTVSGGGDCYLNQPITLIATPNEGYVFRNWTKNGTVVSYVSKYNVTVTESAEYVANFELAPEGIVVGDATYTNAFLPTYYYYSLSEQIYTASEMGGVATDISSVSFFNTSSYGVTRNMNIYMVNTDKTSFEGSTDWIPITESNLVFSGNATFTSYGWVTIYFNTPFNYDGVSNVALIVDDNTNSYNTYTSCRTFDAQGNQALRIYGSGTNYDPYAPTDYSGTLMSMKNQVVFGIPSYDYTVTVSADPTNGGTVSGGGGLYFYGQPITLTATPNEGFVFNNWTKNGTVVSYLSTAQVSVTETAEYVANFQQVDGIIIGNGTYTNSYLPTYYYYSLSEQIYTASEMGGVATDISSVSFFNTGNYGVTRNMNIYMLNTNKTSFEGTTDWIPVSESNLVFSGSVSMTAYGWVTIYFNTPFVYDGVSNVALIVDDNTNSYNAYTSCRTFDTEVSQAIRISGSGTDYDPYAPTSYTGTIMMTKNQVIFGIPSYDYTVTVSASPEEGGTVSGANAGPYFYGQPLTLTATPNEGYVFNYWTKNGEIVSCISTYVLAVTESAEYVAVFQQVDGVVIGDAINTNAFLPTYTYYPYSLTQQIYTADEMGGEAAEFYSLSFFNTGSAKTRNLSVYLVHTNKTVFESNTDWITVTEEDLVFSGSVVANATDWMTVIFDTPFSYDGISNVALIVDDNTNYWNSGLSCRTFNTVGNQALRVTSSGTNYDPYAPTGYSGSLVSMKNQVIFHLPNTVVATASPTAGGTVSGAGYYAYGATCTLTAMPNSGYYFLNWTENGNVVSYDIAYSFTVDGDKNLVANFVAGESTCMISFDLYSSLGSGWYGNYLVVDYGDGNTEQLTLSSGSSISYSREVATGSTIALSWIAGSYTYRCSFDVKFDNGVMIYHGASLSSSFQQELNINCAVATAPHTITAVADPEEGGTIEGAGTYEGGTAITLTAIPNEGYAFCFWSENGQQVSTNASYSFLVESDRNLVARFSLPLTVSVAANMAEGGTTTGAGMYYYGNTCTLTATPSEGYLFLNWSKNGEVVSCNATYSFAVTEDVDLEAVFMLLEGTLIGQGESTNQYLPSYSYYCYTLSQQIYTPNEIGVVGNITSISYFNAGDTETRKYDIYLVHTDKTTFDNANDWIAVSDADRVFSGNVIMSSGYWTTIVFDTPFAYNGSSNLAIVIDDNTGGYTGAPHMDCRVFNANGNQAIRVYSDGVNYDPYSPSGYSGTRYTVKNQIILGIETEVEQIITLSQGSNWFSTYVDISLEDLQNALVEALPGATSITIKAKTQSSRYNGSRWRGTLDWDVAQMYILEVPSGCEIALTGMPVNPAEHPITIIANGANWIGFPFSESMSLDEIFSGFAVSGDVIRSKTGNARYTGTSWRTSNLNGLEPGKGYIFQSNSAVDRTLIFPTGAK